MLMNIECSVVQSIKVALTFDDNKTKEREIAVGDLCYFEYNKNGSRKIIEGKVIKIGASDSTDTKAWFIVVDGSLDYSGQMARFCPNQILDCDIIQKHDTVQYISSPNDSSRVTDIRYINGYIQVSNDGGYSWMTPKNIDVFADEDDDDSSSTSSCHRKKPHKKPVVIEDEDGDTSDDSDDDVIEDENY